MFASNTIDIDQLSVTSIEVTANYINLTDNQSINLDQRPDGITLVVTALFSNSSELVITADNTLDYLITTNDVIEEKQALTASLLFWQGEQHRFNSFTEA